MVRSECWRRTLLDEEAAGEARVQVPQVHAGSAALVVQVSVRVEQFVRVGLKGAQRVRWQEAVRQSRLVFVAPWGSERWEFWRFCERCGRAAGLMNLTDNCRHLDCSRKEGIFVPERTGVRNQHANKAKNNIPSLCKLTLPKVDPLFVTIRPYLRVRGLADQKGSAPPCWEAISASTTESTILYQFPLLKQMKSMTRRQIFGDGVDCLNRTPSKDAS